LHGAQNSSALRLHGAQNGYALTCMGRRNVLRLAWGAKYFHASGTLPNPLSLPSVYGTLRGSAPNFKGFGSHCDSKIPKVRIHNGIRLPIVDGLSISPTFPFIYYYSLVSFLTLCVFVSFLD